MLGQGAFLIYWDDSIGLNQKSRDKYSQETTVKQNSS